MSDQPTLLGGRYQVGEVLGRGGMAEVRQARDTRLGRDVAIKQLRVDLATDPTFQARFRREAQAAAGLNHPNIVSVYDTGEELDPITHTSVPYIVMELVHGETLRAVLRSGRKLLPERAMELAQGVLLALGYSHKHGIIHRDIKPANVMLTPTGQVKVMDFGIARAVSDTSATMTQTAAVIGTAQYLSPEQARGETVDSRSDIYSLGCLLYELLTGRPPFQGDSPVSVAYQHVRELPVAPSSLDSEITTSMDAIALKALAKDPADRYQTAQEMNEDITRLLNGREITAHLPAQPVTPAAAAATAPTVVAPAAAAATPYANPPREAATRTSVPSPSDDDDEPEKRGRGGIVALTILALVFIGLVAAGLIYFNSQPDGQPDTVEVPSVISFPRATAEQRLEEAGLVAEVKEVEGEDDQSVGTVVKQSPFTGETVARGSTVVIDVNVGPKKLTIPDDLVGKDKDDVVEALRKAGFTTITAQVSESAPDGAKADEVLSINPSEGATIAADEEIVVEYASGQTEVPNVSGLSEDDATSKLEESGFKVRVKYEESSAQTGTVISQDPAAFRTAKSGARVTITVAKEMPISTATATQPPDDDDEADESTPATEASG